MDPPLTTAKDSLGGSQPETSLYTIMGKRNVRKIVPYLDEPLRWVACHYGEVVLSQAELF